MVWYVRDRPVREVHQADYTLVGTTVLGVVASLSFFEQRLQSKTYLLYSSCSLPCLVIEKKTLLLLVLQLQLTKEQSASVP